MFSLAFRLIIKPVRFNIMKLMLICMQSDFFTEKWHLTWS